MKPTIDIIFPMVGDCSRYKFKPFYMLLKKRFIELAK